MRKSNRIRIITLLILASILLAGCIQKDEAPVEYDKQLYCDAIKKVFKEHGYTNIKLNEEFSDDRSYLYTAVSDNLENDIDVWLYWGGNISVKYTINKYTSGYATYDIQLIADLLNSVGKYTFTSEFIDGRITAIRKRCNELGENSYTMEFRTPDSPNILNNGCMNYYVSKGIGEGCELWEKGYRDREEFDIACSLRVLEK